MSQNKWELIEETSTRLNDDVRSEYVTKRFKVDGGYIYRYTSVHYSNFTILNVNTQMVFVPNTKKVKKK